MTYSEIQERSYKATVKRGLITPQTTKAEFILKMYEEVAELMRENDLILQQEELVDIILVCFAMAKHFNIDIKSQLSRKVAINENRLF
jgi:NTP pyrophosphatase (non-canonical NTP hydrolase)